MMNQENMVELIDSNSFQNQLNIQYSH